MLKRRIVKVLLIILAVWAVISIVWFSWSRITYVKYCNGMTQNEFSNVIVPRYYTEDNDYTYLVKYPDYLSLTGNLGVSAKDTNSHVMGFIIWPTELGGAEYGLLIQEDAGGYQIYTDKNGTPLDEKYQDIVSKYADEVDKIVQAANMMWGEK